MLTRLVAGRATPLRHAVRVAARSIASTSSSSNNVLLDDRPAAARLESLVPSSFPSSNSQSLPTLSSIAPEALTVPRQHQPTHGIPVGLLHLRSHSPSSLNLFLHFALHAAYALNIPASRPAALPTKRSLYTVIRSPFAHKKSQENFERIVHRRAVKVWDTDMEVFNAWAKYLEINALGGVDMRFVRWERVEVGFGKKRLEEVGRYEDALDVEGFDAREAGKAARQVLNNAVEAQRAVDGFFVPGATISTSTLDDAKPRVSGGPTKDKSDSSEPSVSSTQAHSTPSKAAPVLDVTSASLEPEATSTPFDNIPVTSTSASAPTPETASPASETKSPSVVAPADVEVSTPSSSKKPVS